MQIKILHALCCSWTDGGDLRPADFAGVVIQFKKNFEKRLDPVRARKNNPVVTVRILHKLRERAQIARWLDPNRRQLKHICAECTQLAAECARLFSRPR